MTPSGITIVSKTTFDVFKIIAHDERKNVSIIEDVNKPVKRYRVVKDLSVWSDGFLWKDEFQTLSREEAYNHWLAVVIKP